MGLQRTNHRGRIQRNNPIFIHYTKSGDHFELIPSIEQLENNLTRIYDELPSNFNSVPIMDIQQMKTTYLEEKA